MALDRRNLFLLLAAVAAAASLLPLPALAGDATTTRIETRPFYGATVTLEHGVRVFRALPPHGNVIINPGGVTPVYLGIDQHRSLSYNYNYGPDAGAGGYGGGYGSYGLPAYGAGAARGHRGGYVARPVHPHHGHSGHGHGHGRHGHGGHGGGGHGGGGKR